MMGLGASASLRGSQGAMAWAATRLPEAAASATRAAARGADMSVTPRQRGSIYWRNMTLLGLSLVMGLRTLLTILIGWHGTRYNPVRKFANTLMAILLGIEVVNTITWLIGVNIAAAVDHVKPLKPMSAERADHLCFPISVINYWLDPMLYLWHAIMAAFIWLWVVRGRDVEVLQHRIGPVFAAASVLSAAVTAVPIYNKNLGLWPHSNCFVRTSWFRTGFPATGVFLDRWIILPICWMVILVLNIWTVVHLRAEARRYYALGSIKRLQVRLVLITFFFAIIWFCMSIPLYLDKRTFALEMSVKWAFAIGFIDATIYGYPGSVRCFVACLSFIWRLSSRTLTREGRGTQQPQRQRTTSQWETMVSDTAADKYTASSTSAASASSLARQRERGASGSRSGLQLPSWAAPRRQPSPLQPYHIFCTTFDFNYRGLATRGAGGSRECDESSSTTSSSILGAGGSVSTIEEDPLLHRGLEAWIPSTTSAGPQYHLYVVAVQRCRMLARLRQAILNHLGGPARYVLAGAADIGDAVYGRSALLLYARTVDVESGAFRVLATNQNPIVLRAIRGGVKGMLGVAFRYYDTIIAAINAHLPATSVYPSTPASSALEERDKHIESMLRSLRIGAGHELWDAHLQYHHVVLLGNLNYRMQLPPSEMLARVQASGHACQARFEEDREQRHRGGAGGLEWCWRRGAGYNRLWALAEAEQRLLEEEEAEAQAASFFQRRRSRGGSMDEGGWGIGLTEVPETETEAEAQGQPVGSSVLMANAWGWVKEHDVLSRRMEKGLLLQGFREAPITFPPTFKWRVGGSAEDYADRRVLENAYVTSHRRRGEPRVPVSASASDWAPSYTDRVLVCSHSTRRVMLGPYDMCDEGPLAKVSDHRPVALALTLIIDTSQLPRVEGLDLRAERAPSPPLRSEAASATANAMALAAMQRRERQRPRSEGGARVRGGAGGGGGGGRIQRLLALQRQPLSPAQPFPMLLCLAFSNFRFNFRGLDVVMGDLMETTLLSALQEQGKAGLGLGTVEEGLDEEVKQPQEGLRPGTPPRPQQLAGGNSTSSDARSMRSAPSWLRWRSFVSDQEAGRGAGGRGAAGEPTSAAERIVDHVLILYPLPCEDPLWSLRKAQAIGDSLAATAASSTPSRRPTSSGGGGGVGGGGGRRSRGPPSESGAAEERESQVPKSRTKCLQNLHEIKWQQGFEVLDRAFSPVEGEERRSSGGVSPPVDLIVGGGCRGMPGEKLAVEDSFLVEILNLGPPRRMQHVLIKFMGRRGQELGQGVVCLDDLPKAAGRSSFFSRCARPSEPSPSRVRSGVASPPPEFSTARGIISKRHCVDLSVGGRFRGTVSFDLAVKVKKRAGERGAIEVAQQEQRRQQQEQEQEGKQAEAGAAGRGGRT